MVETPEMLTPFLKLANGAWTMDDERWMERNLSLAQLAKCLRAELNWAEVELRPQWTWTWPSLLLTRILDNNNNNREKLKKLEKLTTFANQKIKLTKIAYNLFWLNQLKKLTPPPSLSAPISTYISLYPIPNYTLILSVTMFIHL